MYGELMRIKTLVERVEELKETNRRLQTLNAELVSDLKEAQKGYRVATWGGVLSVLGFITRTSG